MICPKCRKTIHSLDWSTDGIINMRLTVRRDALGAGGGYVTRTIRNAHPHNDSEGEFDCPNCGETLFTDLAEAKKALLEGEK